MRCSCPRSSWSSACNWAIWRRASCRATRRWSHSGQGVTGLEDRSFIRDDTTGSNGDCKHLDGFRPAQALSMPRGGSGRLRPKKAAVSHRQHGAKARECGKSCGPCVSNAVPEPQPNRRSRQDAQRTVSRSPLISTFNWSFAIFPDARRTKPQTAVSAIKTPGATRGHRGKWIMS